MPVAGITGAVPQVKETSRRAGSTLGKDEFLKILVAQMRNQNPNNPMEDTQFIAQMAQFSSLEQMQNVSKSSALQQAMMSIGNDLKAKIQNPNGTQELVYGRITAVQQNGSDIYLNLDDGRQVKDTDVNLLMNFDGLEQEAKNLVGRNIYLKNMSGNGQGDKVEVTGERKVADEKGNPAVQLQTSDGQTIKMSDIWNIATEQGTL